MTKYKITFLKRFSGFRTGDVLVKPANELNLLWCECMVLDGVFKLEPLVIKRVK